MNSKQESLDEIIEECLAQIPAIVTHEELADYKKRAKSYCNDRVIEELEDTVKLMEVFDTAEGEAVRKHLSVVIRELKGDLK